MGEMNFIELPSGKLINIENLLYVSEIKDVSVKVFNPETEYFEIEVMWANKQIEKIKYTNLETINLDYNCLKNKLL